MSLLAGRVYVSNILDECKHKIVEKSTPKGLSVFRFFRNL